MSQHRDWITARDIWKKTMMIKDGKSIKTGGRVGLWVGVGGCRDTSSWARALTTQLALIVAVAASQVDLDATSNTNTKDDKTRKE